MIIKIQTSLWRAEMIKGMDYDPASKDLTLWITEEEEQRYCDVSVEEFKKISSAWVAALNKELI